MSLQRLEHDFEDKLMLFLQRSFIGDNSVGYWAIKQFK